MKVAVVGHSEWVTFCRLPALPGPGDILHAQEHWEEPAGGGAVAAGVLARLAGSATFFTSIGQDAPGALLVRALEARHVTVHAARREAPHPRAFTFIDDAGERTITVLGAGLKPSGREPLPWGELATMDAVYFVSGDVEALRQARRAKVLVATARVLSVLAEGEVPLDVLVHSESDASERYEEGDLPVRPRVVVTTQGRKGGLFRTVEGGTGRYAAAALEGPLRDAYGAGDSFAAGLTFALGRGLALNEALTVAAKAGASALCVRGAG